MATTTTRDDGTRTRSWWPHRQKDDDETIDLTDERHDHVRDERSVDEGADVGVDRDRDGGVDRRERARAKPGFGYTLRIVLATLLAAAVAVVAAVNTADVELDYVTDATTAPLWWIIAAAAVAGLLIGRLLPRTR